MTYTPDEVFQNFIHEPFGRAHSNSVDAELAATLEMKLKG